MKQAFRESLHLGKKNIEKLEIVNQIIEEYAEKGYKLTLRQLYYQLVSRDIIPNIQKEYASLSQLLVKGKMGGMVDWNAIEDRLRVPQIPYYVEDIPEAIQDAADYYRLDRQKGQDNYIEIWCEKDAISNVLKRKTQHYHVRLMVNRGYSSCTAMYDAHRRFALQHSEGRKGYILYLGDHDPSGLDMVRDVRERLMEFGRPVEVEQIAITMEQIRKYNPPPNPAKITDPRAKWYIAEHGNTSWEVDALSPEVLHEIIEKHIKKLIDIAKFDAMMVEEEKDREELKEMADDYNQ